MSVASAKSSAQFAHLAEAPALEAAAMLEWGIGLWRQGEYQAARTPLEQGLALARKAGAGKTETDLLRNMGNVNWFLGISPNQHPLVALLDFLAA